MPLFFADQSIPQALTHCVPLQLITIIRQDLNLTKSGASGAAIAAVTGTIFARVASAHLVPLYKRIQYKAGKASPVL